jgi:hypothetical protein
MMILLMTWMMIMFMVIRKIMGLRMIVHEEISWCLKLLPRYPCLYAHCLKSGRDRTASWIVGEDRTVENLLENQLR